MLKTVLVGCNVPAIVYGASTDRHLGLEVAEVELTLFGAEVVSGDEPAAVGASCWCSLGAHDPNVAAEVAEVTSFDSSRAG